MYAIFMIYGWMMLEIIIVVFKQATNEPSTNRDVGDVKQIQNWFNDQEKVLSLFHPFLHGAFYMGGYHNMGARKCRTYNKHITQYTEEIQINFHAFRLFIK